ncbi:MAG: N-methyl-L-tryptophan oxidase [Alphaproteobacteria bacterium]
MARPDVIVVGVGSVGAGAFMALAKAGVKVLGVDRWAPPHTGGSHHGESRITRLGVGEGADCVPLAVRTHQRWRELEAQRGTEILFQVGGAVIAQPGVGRNHGQDDFLGATIANATAHDIPHELLDAEELARRLPMMRFVGDETGYWEPSAGYIRPDRAIGAMIGAALDAGAELRTGAAVQSVDIDGARPAIVLADGERLEADRVILSAGARVRQLVDLPVATKVTRQVLQWSPIQPDKQGLYDPATCPVFIRQTREGDFYGFPAIDGPEGGIKVAAETSGPDVDPDTLTACAPDAECLDILDRIILPVMRGLDRRILKSAICRYTEIPNARFLMDTHPARDDIIIASTCSGHGFKHSAAIGEKLAHMACGIPILDQIAALDFSAATH